MTGDQLAEYLPFYGDRLAVFGYLQTEGKKNPVVVRQRSLSN